MSQEVIAGDVPEPRKRAFDVGRLLESDLLMGALAIFAILAIWEAATIILAVRPYILPAPTTIVTRVAKDLVGGEIFKHLPITLAEILIAFAFAIVAGILFGTMVALVPLVERMFYPLVLALQTVPKVAVAPLFLIWFGFGMQSKIVTAALIAFFPIFINVVAGLKAVQPQRIQLMRALKASHFKTFMSVRLPSMLPFLFAGLQIGLVFAIIGVIVSEFIGGTKGLGVLIIMRQGEIDTAGVFSVLIYLSIMGLTMSFLLRRVAQYYTFWEQQKS
jgi:NitT/TauT family transport system permease protein